VKAGRYFDSVSSLPVKDWRELTGEKPFVILSPHPDDESLGAGGLIALTRRHNQQVAVVLLTDGSKSHPNSQVYPRDRLIVTRRAEFAEAGRILGLSPDRVFELGLPDAAAPTVGLLFEKSVDSVGDIVTTLGARSLFVTWEHDPHCDHRAAARLAVELRRRHPSLRLWWYPVWGWHLPPSQTVSAPAPEGLRLAIDAVLPQKRAAIEAHLSQTTDLIHDDPDGFRLTAELLAPFLKTYEHYIEVPPR
jgi:LmbE family N-acetylglucosaminyl deacetylase